MSSNPGGGVPMLELMQQWTGSIGRAQQLLLKHWVREASNLEPGLKAARSLPSLMPRLPADPAKLFQAQSDFWADSMRLWQSALGAEPTAPPASDRRFAAEAWHDNPLFDLIRRSYALVADHLLRGVETLEGLDDKGRERLRFAATTMIDALSPANFALTNPEVIEKTIETRGENLVKGLERLLDDLTRGQLTQTDTAGFTLGGNIANTPGKVVLETPLFQLIQYRPATEQVREIPLLIFPPWINRFYILDLNQEKSFIRWAVGQGMTVFVVSWKSADESHAEILMRDYVIDGQLRAIDTVRDLLGVEAVNVVGYCVAGTTLAATLALLAARGEADKVRSATFFTAQVDFENAGDLMHFIDDQQLEMLSALSAGKGYLDGRYLAATFNLLRGRDLIWNYVVNNYMLGKDYQPFDLLYWNSHSANLPAKWHREYLTDLYRDNKLVVPGALSIDGTPIDLTRVQTPAYIQAGREDHIAPAESVWKMTHHLKGPLRFVLAGSGHIAGVVNPPAAGKYQYWVGDSSAATLPDYLADATETKGSWWPDWLGWMEAYLGESVDAGGARVPGGGKLPALEDAPGSYVTMR